MKQFKIKTNTYYLLLSVIYRILYIDIRKKFIKYNSYLRKNKKDEFRQINSYFLFKNLLPLSQPNQSKALYINNIKCTIPKEKYIHNKKKVSVLITLFNQTELLEYAINSIINQTYRNIEIIIVDDGSTEDTRNILESFNSKYEFIKVIYLKENHGTFVAKNIALDYADGDYITFHDSDDWAHPQRLQEQIKAIEKNKTSASISKLVRIKPNGELYSKDENVFDRLCLISLMIKKEVIPEIGYFLKNRTGSDTEYYERVKNFAEKSCIKVNKVLTFCAKRENSLTTCEIEGVWEKTDNPKRVNFMKRWRNWHKGFIEKDKKPFIKFDRKKYNYKINI